VGLLTELRRRKVFRVAAVYAAVAFVVLQAADIMLPRLGVPDWAMSLIVVLLVQAAPRFTARYRASGAPPWPRTEAVSP
jgi:hypothetical protein